jgi:hypothetical protein
MLQKGTEQHDVVPESRILLHAMVSNTTIEAATSCPEKISVMMTMLA